MNSLMRKCTGVLLAITFVCFHTGDLHADANAQAQTFFPSIDTSKYFSVYSSQTMQAWQWRAGTYVDYAYRPIEFVQNGSRFYGVTDHLVVSDLYGSLGITDWLQVGLNFPIVVYERLFDPRNNPISNPSPGKNVSALGDLRLETKIRLINDFIYPVGLSIRPYITFPTGNGEDLAGNDSFTGGGDLIFDFSIGKRVTAALNAGFRARSSVTPANLNVEEDDKFTYGGGVNVKATDWMDVIGEAYGAALTGNFFGKEDESPLEVLGGFRFYIGEAWEIDVGAGAGATFGYGSPDFRALAGVSYTKPRIVDIEPKTEPLVIVEEKKIVITEKIHFEFDKAVIRPTSYAILDAVVEVMSEHTEITKVRVEGHTDAVGSDAYNKALSDRRAKSVRDYLVDKGVAGDRLVSKGYGEGTPIATNDTAEGRAQNRRTEFTILEKAKSK